MANINSTLPSLPFSYAQWKKDTAITLPAVFDTTARKKFEAVDRAVEVYLVKPTQSTLVTLKAALRDWIDYKEKKGGKGAWAESQRNRTFLIAYLHAALFGDTDQMLGVPDFMSAGMVNARLGILYLFSRVAWSEGPLRIVTQGVIDFAGRSGGASARRTVEARRWLTTPAKDSVEPARRPLRDRLVAQLESLHDRLAAAIDAQLPGEHAGPDNPKQLLAIWEVIPGGLKTVCRCVADKAVDQAGPFIANGAGVAEALLQAISAGADRYVAHCRCNGVAIVPGTPRSIIDGIKRAMDSAIVSGAYNVLKGAGALTLEGLSVGLAGTITDLAFSVVEAFVALIRRVRDFYRLRVFRLEAQQHWDARESAAALHRRPSAFNAWYRRTALKVPAVPCLTLASGICGDKMHMLRMFGDEGERITQASFDAGVKYLDSLKAWGRTYLADLGYDFSSDDPVIARLIAST